VTLLRETRLWWRDRTGRLGFSPTLRQFVAILSEFARESTPASRRRRYGDVEFDWDHRVDTTGATVGWRDRFIGHLHSAYQPTEPAAFHEMMGAMGIEFPDFTFIDIGSGKGRVLLMAAEYPFRRVIGVELLPSLHGIAKQNIARCESEARRCCFVESINQNAVDFSFPNEAMVVYLFNPLGEVNLMKVVEKLNRSLKENPRSAYVLYHNALLGHVLLNTGWRKLRGELYFSLFSFAG
jgi:SAM-dependent methyltransferase